MNSTIPRIAADEHDNVAVNVTFYSNDGTEPLVAWWRKDKESKIQIQNRENKYTAETFKTTVYVKFYLKTIQQPGYLSQLLISNISDSDFATYQIEVFNSVGIVTSDITISPTGNCICAFAFCLNVDCKALNIKKKNRRSPYAKSVYFLL